MFKRMVLGLLFVLLPGAAWAQPKQEDYLPAKTQIYLRWDGMEQHQTAYDKTAVGKMMQGETGKFVEELCKFILTTADQGAAQLDPKAGPLLKDLVKVLIGLHKDGIVLGVDVDKINPPVVQGVLVFPKAAGESGTLLPLIQKIAEETKAPVKQEKVGKRFINTVQVELLQLGWWAQGNDAVIFIGTTDPVAYAKDIDAKKTGITKHLLYQKVANFKSFETASRGYVDVTRLLTVAADIAPPAGKIIDELGLKGIKSITFVSGFDGTAERSIVEADMPGPRKGILSLASQKKISLKDLPVLPDDLSTFSAGSANLAKSYEIITGLITGVAGVIAPGEVENITGAIKAFEGALGVDINKELFANLGDVVVSYNSPSDGFLGTGAVVAIQLKDGKKMNATIDKLIKAIPPIPGGGEVSLKKKPYKEGDIMQLTMAGPMVNSHMGSIGIYKNWLIYSQYPTAIKGFIMRQEGELPAWKADDTLTKVLANYPDGFNSLQVSDPRPTVKTLLAITPLVMNLVNTFGPLGVPGYQPFDLQLIPHPQEATRHLFPNVTVGTDDGKRARSETRGSLLLPF